MPRLLVALVILSTISLALYLTVGRRGDNTRAEGPPAVSAAPAENDADAGFFKPLTREDLDPEVRALLRPRPPVVLPGMTPAPTPSPAVGAAIDAAKPRVENCYARARSRDPSLSGEVEVSLQVETRDGKGRITRGEVVNGQPKPSYFETCVAIQLRGLAFTDPTGQPGQTTALHRFHLSEPASPSAP